jgi:radical SAM protein with 4Fe4S-binding SPASM domain
MEKLDFVSPWIHTTNQCNLDCSYCHVKKNNQIMSDEVYYAINDRFIDMLDNGETDRIIYRIAGGEPLLVIDKWFFHMSNFIERSKGRGHVEIITNLSILPEKLIILLRSYPKNVGLSVSLDGLYFSKPFKHDKQTSSYRVLENLNQVDRICHPYILTTITEKTIKELNHLADYISLKDYGWKVAIDYFYKGELLPEIIIDNLKLSIDQLFKNKYDLFKFKLNHCDFKSNNKGCLAGKNLISIFPDGSLSVCQTVPINSNFFNILNPELNIFADFLYSIINSISDECIVCSAFSICHGDCKLYNIKERKQYLCPIIKEVVHYLGVKIIEQEDRNNAKL